MAITYTTKKYRILQKTSTTTADIMHPETEAEITLIKPITGIDADNAQKALEKLNDKINIVDASILYGTKEYWDSQPSLRTDANTIYVYTNAFTYTEGGQTITVAGMKIGDGNAYLAHVAFITDYLAYKIDELKTQFEAHLADTVHHVDETDRARWDHKMNYEDEIVNETLVINRN